MCSDDQKNIYGKLSVVENRLESYMVDRGGDSELEYFSPLALSLDDLDKTIPQASFENNKPFIATIKHYYAQKKEEKIELLKNDRKKLVGEDGLGGLKNEFRFQKIANTTESLKWQQDADYSEFLRNRFLGGFAAVGVGSYYYFMNNIGRQFSDNVFVLNLMDLSAVLMAVMMGGYCLLNFIDHEFMRADQQDEVRVYKKMSEKAEALEIICVDMQRRLHKRITDLTTLSTNDIDLVQQKLEALYEKVDTLS